LDSWLAQAQPIIQGFRPFVARFPAIGSLQGVLKEISNPNSSVTLLFVKAGRNTTECHKPDAVVALAPGETLKEDDLQKIFNSKTPGLPVYFVACVASAIANSPLAINIRYRYTS
jgi:hypothetical protein